MSDAVKVSTAVEPSPSVSFWCLNDHLILSKGNCLKGLLGWRMMGGDRE